MNSKQKSPRGWFSLNLCGLVVFTLLVLSVAASLWQGQYNIDHIHWGLMLSNAKDWVGGRIPYKDIFIQYGFLTTLIHGAAYAWGGGNLQALIAVTAVAYALGLWMLYVMAKAMTKDALLALYIFATGVLLHPITMYPWSNYLAFPFLMLGLYGSVAAGQRAGLKVLTGLSFGLAILTREGLAPSVLVFLAGSIFLDFLSAKHTARQTIRGAAWLLVGVFTPLLLFLSYLKGIDALPYWFNLAWNLPKVYAQTYFPHMRGLGLAMPLLRQIGRGILALDVRWILLAAIFISNALVVVAAVFNKNFRQTQSDKVKLAIFCLLLISSALHLPEIFRLATGSIVGLVNLYLLLKAMRLHHAVFAVSALAMAITIAPADSGESFSTTNYFFPSAPIINNSSIVAAPSYFRGQRWDDEAVNYYANIEHDLSEIAKRCDVHDHYNYTYDVFLQVLSPFRQYQLAPFFTEKQMSALRSDLDIDRKISSGRDLVIFQQTPNGEVADFVAPAGFSVYKSYKTPRTNFLYRDNALLILVPTDCLEALERR